MGNCACAECTHEEKFVFYERYYNPVTKRTSHNTILQPQKNQEILQSRMQSNHEYMSHFEPSRFMTVRNILMEKKGVPICIINRIMKLAEEDDRCEGCKFYRGQKLSHADNVPRTCAACKAENLTLIPERKAKRTFKSLTGVDFAMSPKYIVRSNNGRKRECYRVKDLEKLYNRGSEVTYMPRKRKRKLKKTQKDETMLSQSSQLTQPSTHEGIISQDLQSISSQDVKAGKLMQNSQQESLQKPSGEVVLEESLREPPEEPSQKHSEEPLQKLPTESLQELQEEPSQKPQEETAAEMEETEQALTKNTEIEDSPETRREMLPKKRAKQKSKNRKRLKLSESALKPMTDAEIDELLMDLAE